MWIFYQNVNGLCTKTEEFKVNVWRKDYDIILLTESKLYNYVKKGELFPSHYTVYRRDREDREGGGVLIAIKSDKDFQKRKWHSAECEDSWITVKHRNYKIHICCVYLPGSLPTDDFISFVDNVEKRMKGNKNDRFLIVGDFNLPDYTSAKSLARDGSKKGVLQDLEDFYGLRQLNRGRNVNGRTLDLVFCNEVVSVTKERGLVAEDAHHPALKIKL